MPRPRIAFKVSQKVDSRVILDQMGAEALLGRGDMLFHTGGAQGAVRLQGAYISDDEIERLADHHPRAGESALPQDRLPGEGGRRANAMAMSRSAPAVTMAT